MSELGWILGHPASIWKLLGLWGSRGDPFSPRICILELVSGTKTPKFYFPSLMLEPSCFIYRQKGMTEQILKCLLNIPSYIIEVSHSVYCPLYDVYNAEKVQVLNGTTSGVWGSSFTCKMTFWINLVSQFLNRNITHFRMAQDFLLQDGECYLSISFRVQIS